MRYVYIIQFIKKCKDEKKGSHYKEDIVDLFEKKISEKWMEMSDAGRTSQLWAQYHNMVSLIKVYIRAERLHDWKLHLTAVANMLSGFASAGHGQYAKGARLYLEMMEINTKDYKSVMDMFRVNGYHTVRYSPAEWSGIWTDLSIEQLLMKSCKSSGGLTGGRLRNIETADKL